MYVIIFIREVIFVTCIKGGYMLKLKNVSKFYYINFRMKNMKKYLKLRKEVFYAKIRQKE